MSKLVSKHSYVSNERRQALRLASFALPSFAVRHTKLFEAHVTYSFAPNVSVEWAALLF